MMNRLGTGLLLCAIACTPARMQVAPDLAAASEAMMVTDRSSWTGSLVDESFRFGPYRVTEVDRKWSTGSGWGVGAYATHSSVSGYSFVLEAPVGKIAGRCGTEVDKSSVKLFGGEAYNITASLACACGPDATGSRFVLRSDGHGLMAGAAMIGGAEVALRPINQMEGGYTAGQAFGYEARGTEVVAGVEVVHPGRVWLARSLVPPAAADMACLAAGLLLYVPPDAHATP